MLVILYDLLKVDLKYYCPKARDRNGNPFFFFKKKIGMYSPKPMPNKEQKLIAPNKKNTLQ